jgi:hypothetical protein
VGYQSVWFYEYYMEMTNDPLKCFSQDQEHGDHLAESSVLES